LSWPPACRPPPKRTPLNTDVRYAVQTDFDAIGRSAIRWLTSTDNGATRDPVGNAQAKIALSKTDLGVLRIDGVDLDNRGRR
jgi:hypothetical protein